MVLIAKVGFGVKNKSTDLQPTYFDKLSLAIFKYPAAFFWIKKTGSVSNSNWNRWYSSKIGFGQAPKEP